MTDVYFSFDTEDFTSNAASDAIVNEAKILHSFGVRGNFNVVGYLARELVRNRRTDVLDALKDHTISFHSLGHSYHPTICEYTDLEDYSAARAELERQEMEGMGMVKAACGVDSFAAACPPGNSFSYVAMYAYADFGIPLYVGSIFPEDEKGVYFCNGYHMPYNVALETKFHETPDYDLKKFLDWMAELPQVVLYNHPNRVQFSNFWDLVNYYKTNAHPMYEWEEAPQYSAAETAHYYQCLCELLQALREDKRFRICSMDDTAKEAIDNLYGRTVTRDQLPEITRKLKENFRWMSAPVSLSVADCFFAAQYFLLHPSENEYHPDKVHGFLDEPVGTETKVTLSAEEIRTLAKQCDPKQFLPASFAVGGKKIGPADLLFAMLEAAQGAETVAVEPKHQQCAYEEIYPQLRDLHFAGTWVHSDELKDNWLSRRLRLQAWTIRSDR